MSTDEILAANLWPWPDPLLKRDQNGRILFVNAAFLQLYGGRVEDWSGQVINGWPAPVSQGAQRFETRAGQAPSETVFDWVEMVMSDGNAMAIARNVTIFMTSTTPPKDELPILAPQIQEQATPQQNIPLAPALSPQQAPEQAPALNTQNTPPQGQNLDTQALQSDLTASFEDTLNNDADDYAYDSDAAAIAAQPQLQNNTNESVASQTAPPVTIETPQAVSPAASQAPQAQVQMERATPERRTLPIKDSSSVLGNNWRDQVIARAVGAELPSDNNQENNADGASTDDDTNETTASAGESLVILLAEDNAINALLTRTLLEAEGATVEVVEDGVLAVEAVKLKSYDLIFMDMRMPNMDGLESTRKIRAFGFEGPIIALTANAFDDDRNACFDSGMNDFMTKPVSAEELSEMVITWTKEKDADQKIAS